MSSIENLVIETHGLGKSYKNVVALKSLDLKVAKHSIFGFLGPNGAGKTTTIKLLLGLVGAVLMLGLVQRWGEVFPRWMIGLAGRMVPIPLAVVPASLASVLLIVGGIGIWVGLPQMVANLGANGVEGIEVIGAIIFQVGPTLLFPVWGAALAVATLGYYYRRRGPCSVCGRGASGEASELLANPSSTGHTF